MAVVKGDAIKGAEIAARFNERVRDLIAAETSWVSSTAVWNTNVGTVVANSTGAGGGINRTAEASTAAQGMLASDLTNVIGAQPTVAGHITKVMRDLMAIYARSFAVALYNTGNLAPSSYVGTVRFTTGPASIAANIQSDVDAAIIANGMTSGNVVSAANLEAFMNACKTAWNNRASASVMENYYYYYCHSSFGSFGSHGSRGRR